VNKVWYARQLGFLANVAPAIGPVIGFILIKLVAASAITDKLYWSCVAFFGPPAVLMLIAASTLLRSISRQQLETIWRDIKLILRRGRGHWLFAVLAAITLKVDYIVMSQVLRGDDIVSYNIASMIFTSIFFIYAALLAALWPSCAEAIARNQWHEIGGYLRRYISLGIVLIVIATSLIAFLRPQILHLLSPKTPVSLGLGLISVFGVYFVIRVWTDTFGMILQSISAMKIFLIAVPIEAAIAVALQILFVRRFGPMGIPAALIVAYLCTVSWIMPVTLYRKHQAAILNLRSRPFRRSKRINSPLFRLKGKEMLHSPESDLFETYGFNPYQFSLPDEEMLEFHRRHVSYFAGCSKVLDLGAGRGFFLRAFKRKRNCRTWC